MVKQRTFRNKPSCDLAIKALNCLGFKNLDDFETLFLLEDVEKLDSIEKYKEIKEEIKSCYTPNIAKLYFGNNKCGIKNIITVIRHLIKVKNRNIVMNIKYNSEQKKYINIYKLVIVDPNIKDPHSTITFD